MSIASANKDVKELCAYTFGDKSHMNLLGKVLLSPLMAIFIATWWLCKALLAKAKP